MTHSRPITFLTTAALIPLAALTVAACGGGGAATASPAPKTTKTTKTTKTPTPTIRVFESRLGSILVDSTGRTLYLFKADVGAKSACTGACAAAWPPLMATGNPVGGRGVTPAKLGTITRPGGSRQATYNGHPLYLFIKDQKPGDVKGQGVVAFGAAWFAISPKGNQIAGQPARQQVPAAPAAPEPAPQPAPSPAPKTAPQPPPPPPAAKPAPPASSGIPQNNGGDGDGDNNGGPSDGDGNI